MYPFWKITPGGNPTVLLLAEDIPQSRRASVANAVMNEQHLCAEQVGYIRFDKKPRLDMMGGEFCLNATRAFAALLAEKKLLSPCGKNSFCGNIEVSGVQEDVSVRVVMGGEKLSFAEACLHFSSLPVPEIFPEGRILIHVPGISHIIENGSFPAPANIAAYCEKERLLCAVSHQEAVGHLWLGKSTIDGEIEKAELIPVVWVRDTNTLCRESACGSGTLAAALALHSRNGRTVFRIQQPSGSILHVRMEKQRAGWDIWVGGPVRMTARGETDLTGILL